MCSRIGGICNIDAQSSLTTNELVAEKMLEAGYTCKGFHGSRGYAGTPFATGRSDDCAPITTGTKSTCDTKPAYSYHRSLCFCEKGRY